MTKETFLKLEQPFRKTLHRRRIFVFVEHLFTGLVYLAYPALLFYLLVLRDFRFWRCFLTPAVGLVFVSILRRLINAPRPYEKYDFRPLLPKDKKGESFPSRHLFSVFMIAMAYYYVYVPMGIYLTVLGVLLGVLRVVGGVHFPKDVLVGAAIGVLLGGIGFFCF